MTVFLRLLNDIDKEAGLRRLVSSFRSRGQDTSIVQIEPAEFNLLPGKSFAYWIPPEVRALYRMPAFDDEAAGRSTRCGLGTLDDFRFLRLCWEIGLRASNWVTYFHGGSFSPFYDDFPMVVDWSDRGRQIKRFVESKVGSASRKVQGEDKYFTAGFVFPRRTRAFSPKFMAKGGIFSTAGQAGFLPLSDLAGAIALMCSSVCAVLLTISQGTTSQESGGTNPQFEVGQVKRLPWPIISESASFRLDTLARRGWSLKRTRSSTIETSSAFLLPSALRERFGDYRPLEIEAELDSIHAEIDEIAFELYGFADENRSLFKQRTSCDAVVTDDGDDEPDGAYERSESSSSSENELLSWAVGIVIGRFDIRLATGAREMPPEPNPFDPLPAKSPGMLPDGSEPFHKHSGVLVDDQGHPDDLARLVEEVLARVNLAVPNDVRRWLRREFFAVHLQRYSKSRRKAPIYWPLSTTSGSYTLWVYYPELTSQTLYTAVNDFVDPKLKQVSADVKTLRSKGSARTRDDEKQFEALQPFELELLELRDALLKLSPTYKPSLEDGVQISAAPLWPLFRHKPWQKILKETWAKLEKGDYDWAHLAFYYWPERVREKCKTDKSLAIAHGLEDLYIEPKAPRKKARGKKKAEVEE